MSLLRQLREEVGLPMRGAYPATAFTTEDEAGEEVTVIRQMWVGWTTDEEKATLAREAGATVRSYQAHDPRYNGWEVSCNEVING